MAFHLGDEIAIKLTPLLILMTSKRWGMYAGTDVTEVLKC